MNAALFDQLDATLSREGPAVAIDRLCQHLRSAREYHQLFYALLMKTRHTLGVSPLPTSPASELPPSTHAGYEEGIRAAAREVGGLYLAQGNIPQAYGFFRMIDEIEPIRAALENYTPGEEEDVQPLVQISFYEGVHPKKGFDWVLERYGLCSAITTLGGGEMPHGEEVKQYCIRRLVRALYEELRHRLAAEIGHRLGIVPEEDVPPGTPGVIHRLMQGRDWLFGEEAYHIDTSHLSSVVQMSLSLQPCVELGMARELCDYGARLTGRFLGHEDPPFERGYADYAVYLAILAGEDVEKNLDHFRHLVESANPEEVGTYPAEVLVNLLLRLGRNEEALTVARQHLANTGGRPLTCPGLPELCERFSAYETLAETARQQGDVVQFLAGKIAARKG